MDSVSRPQTRYFVTISPRLPWILAGIVTLLLIAHVGIQIYHYRVHEVGSLLKDTFDLNEENNIPTWYSNSTLLLTSGLLLAIATGRRRERAPDARHWLWLSVVFCFLALDEDAGLHETLNTMMDDLHGGVYITWAIPWMLGVLVFAWIYVRFWWKLPPRIRLLFGLAGVGFIGGAVGVEQLTLPADVDSDSLKFGLLTALEEGLEMYSIVLFIHALLLYMRGSDRESVALGVETAG